MRLRRPMMILVPVVRLVDPPTAGIDRNPALLGVIFLILFGTFPHSAGGGSRIKAANAVPAPVLPAQKTRVQVPWERQYKIKPSEKTRLTPPEGVPKRIACLS